MKPWCSGSHALSVRGRSGSVMIHGEHLNGILCIGDHIPSTGCGPFTYQSSVVSGFTIIQAHRRKDCFTLTEATWWPGVWKSELSFAADPLAP